MAQNSNLTRAVFRALIANRPYVSRDCQLLSRQVSSILPVSTTHTVTPSSWRRRRRLPLQQKRYFFDAILGKTNQSRLLDGSNPSTENIERALLKMVDLIRAKRTSSRPPSYSELADALRFLANARFEKKEPLTRNEVFLATETYKHLQERRQILSESNPVITSDDLALITSALSTVANNDRFRSDIRTLAELIRADELAWDPDAPYDPSHVVILARTGSAKDAKEKVLSQQSLDNAVWIEVLKGLSQEAHLADFWSLLDIYQQHRGPLTPEYHEELVLTFILASRGFDTERMFKVPTSVNEPTSSCVCRMLDFALRTGKANLAADMVHILNTRPRDDTIIAYLIIYHMIKDSDPGRLDLLVDELTHSRPNALSMVTINRVIEYALDTGHAKLASAMRELTSQYSIPPDGKTLALELNNALDGQKLDLATDIFSTMQSEDTPDDDSDIAVLNRFVRELAFSPDSSYKTLMDVTDTILARGADLEPNTVAGLTSVFLEREEIDELVGLLQHRIEIYPLPDRALISTVFRTFIMNPQIPTQRAFNAYEVFRHAFQDTPVALRLPLMQSFFDRQRPDLACQVFSHMREAESGGSIRPNEAAYTQAFEGIAMCRDVDGIQIVYNMLKLDMQVELTTKIRNAIMLAYIACQQPWVAIIDHFYKIMDSREGPTYSSFEVAMRACETWPPYGSYEARKIMAVMQSWDLEITKAMYDNYIGALAGQSEFSNVVELIDRMYQDIGEHPDAFTIGTFYNAIPWQFRKQEVETWAKTAYPELWEELLTFGEDIDEILGIRYFRLDRSIDINDPPLFDRGEWEPKKLQDMQSQMEPLPMLHT